ncbi:MAG: helix-turn-helix domain-containing protein [Pseudonocardiaceae bacterium]
MTGGDDGDTGDTGDLAAQRAELKSLRSALGAHLASRRTAAGVSQPQLGQVVGRTRSMVSKIEHGTRSMPARLWQVADRLCGAGGALVAEHAQVAKVEHDCRTRARHSRVRQAPTPVLPSLPGLVGRAPQDGWSGLAQVPRQLAEEFMAVVTKLVRTVGRRQAMHMASWVLAALGLSGLDTEEYTRIAHATQFPNRVDAQVIENLAATLARCKRQEDKLGPCDIVDTILAQHELVHRLLQGCPDKFIKPLKLLDSTISSTIGTCLINMGCPHTAKDYFEHARRAGHEATHPASAAYAAANASFAAFLRRDTPTALDTAAAARSLATRTGDLQLKALAEQMAAAAYALDGQYNPCISATGRAHDLLATGNTNDNAPESPAYWVHHATINSQRSLFLCLLNKPQDAVQAATAAHDHFNRTFAGSYARCHIRLGHALILAKEIPEATHILTQAATLASLGPRLTQELHTTRTLLQPWQHTHPVKTLDDQLHTYGLIPHHKN